jgi:hypothetical protein
MFAIEGVNIASRLDQVKPRIGTQYFSSCYTLILRKKSRRPRVLRDLCKAPNSIVYVGMH